MHDKSICGTLHACQTLGHTCSHVVHTCCAPVQVLCLNGSLDRETASSGAHDGAMTASDIVQAVSWAGNGRRGVEWVEWGECGEGGDGKKGCGKWRGTGQLRDGVWGGFSGAWVGRNVGAAGVGGT